MSNLEETAMSINPFADKDEAFIARSQKIKKAEHYMDDVVQEALDYYNNRNYKLPYHFPHIWPLTPYQIEALLYQIRANNPKERIESALTGEYLSALIQKSKDELGFKEFTLSVGEYTIQSLMHFKLEQDNRGLNIRIFGNTGQSSGEELNRAALTIEGSANKCMGSYSNYSRIIVKDDVGDNCGWRSIRCNITIYGNAGENLGIEANGTTVTLHGDVTGDIFNSGTLNTLRTPNERTFERAIERIREGRENCVQLIDTDGKVIKRVRR